MAAQRYVRVSDLVSRKKGQDTIPGRYPFTSSTLWRLVATGKFPPPIRLANVPAWPVEVLEEWEAAQPVYQPRASSKKAATESVVKRQKARLAAEGAA